MKTTNMGEFEQVVLLALTIRSGDVYGATIVNELEQQLGRSVSLEAMHPTLNRLQEKGLVQSQLSGISAARVGRRKRLYLVTAYGRQALEESRQLRNQLRDAIPQIAWS